MKTVLTRDERIRRLALYDVSRGNTVAAPPAAAWERFRIFKRQLQAGVWDQQGKDPLVVLEQKVVGWWSDQRRGTDEEIEERSLDSVLAAAGLEGEVCGSDS